MKSDYKKIAISILGDDKTPMASPMGFYESETENLAKDIIKAIEEKNHLALKMAMKAFVNSCGLEHEEPGGY